jgi:hypothetical protein
VASSSTPVSSSIMTSSICPGYFKCFICLRATLQGFHMDIAYIVMVVYICCKHLFLMFHLYILQVCLSECCIYFTYMLQSFYPNGAYVLQLFSCFFRCFYKCFDTCFKCFICIQMYVASVVSGCFKSRMGAASPSSLFCCLALVSSPRLLLSCIFLRLRRGRSEGRRRGCAGGLRCGRGACYPLPLRGQVAVPISFLFYVGC